MLSARRLGAAVYHVPRRAVARASGHEPRAQSRATWCRETAAAAAAARGEQYERPPANDSAASALAPVAVAIGADALVYQDIDAMRRSVRDLGRHLNRFEASCFDGVYITGDVTPEYLYQLEASRLNPVENVEEPAQKAQMNLQFSFFYFRWRCLVLIEE